MKKTINLSLVGINGNAFSLIGAFSAQAKKEGWTRDEINEVLEEAMGGDYNHLLRTLDSHCETSEQDEY